MTTPDGDPAVRAQRASALKERIYVAFTALAVIIALRAHDLHPSASLALVTLGITVAATTCAVYLADLLSHMVIHARLPASLEHRHLIASTIGASTVAAPALASIALAWVGVYDTSTGLLIAMLTTVATLAAVGLLAVRRLSVPFPQRLAVLVGESVLALVVVALGLLAHR